MSKDYFKNRPRIQCPNCGAMITKACYKKHYQACINPDSKLNVCRADNTSCQSREDLFCMYCHKECKNKNSLAQHEVRCPNNPNRKDFDKLIKYSEEARGQTAETNERVKRSSSSLRKKYTNGYVHPMRGRKVSFEYEYLIHNNEEINKWLHYIQNNTFTFPQYTVSEKRHEQYVPLSPRINEYLYEHELIAATITGIKDIHNYTVHHINKQRDDNRPENLLVFASFTEHKRFHNSPYAYLTYDEETHLFHCEIKKE